MNLSPPSYLLALTGIYLSSVFQLGQHYLILAEEKDTELNNCLAVHWLIEAAKQGRIGAARLLQRCWIQKKGKCYQIQEYLFACTSIHIHVWVFTCVMVLTVFIKCLSLQGITPENEADVRKLSTESRFEQAVRKAARLMYWKLNPDRKKKVAVAEMLENVNHVSAMQGGSHTYTHMCMQDQNTINNMSSNTVCLVGLSSMW